MHPRLLTLLAELRRAWPFAAALAVVLGAVVVAGANLSNAFPSQGHPFGWAGPASFENAVAMVRPDLVVAAALPGLLLGATALRHREPAATPLGDLGIVVGVDAALLGLASLVAGIIGAWGSFKTPVGAFWAFVVAHALLALAFYAIAFFVASVARKHAVPIAAGLWLALHTLFDHVTQTILFRQMGYDNLTAGIFPPWFFVAQASSPESLYRGVLILWDRKFMDYVEQAALGKAALPGWLTPATFAAYMVGAFVALPLGLAALVWWWRARAARAAVAVPDEEPA
jgi:hypothetical protein